MKKLVLFVLTLFVLLQPSAARHYGVPFFKNISSSEYEANKINFDIVIGKDGTVFVANFEGVLYYDMSSWGILRNKSLTRITSLMRDAKGTVWAGGNNYLGKIIEGGNGSLSLMGLDRKLNFQGEVVRIWEEDSRVVFLASNDTIYAVKDNYYVYLRKNEGEERIKSDFLDEPGITQVLNIDLGIQAVSTNSRGLFLFDDKGNLLYNVTENNGLCSNNIVDIAYNGKGVLWGATDNGLFAMTIPSAYSYFSPLEGLQGAVNSIQKFSGRMYIGTRTGLFYQDEKRFVHLNGINHTCWQLCVDGNRLLAATEEGLFAIDSNNNVKLLNEGNNAMSLLVAHDGFFSGERNGVFFNERSGKRRKMLDLQRVTHMMIDADSTFWMKTLYGQIWYRRWSKAQYVQYNETIHTNEAATLVQLKDSVVVVDALDTIPFVYPQFSYMDSTGATWLTDNDGKGLYAWKNGKRISEFDVYLNPLENFVVSAVYVDAQKVWIGGEKGIFVIDRAVNDPFFTAVPKLSIRKVMLNGSSVLWGGFGEQQKLSYNLNSDENDLFFSFALDNSPLLENSMYRYRMNGGNWSEWSDRTSVRYYNQSVGSHVFEVEAMDPMGRVSEPVSVSFFIRAPYYLRWYMIVVYILLLIALIVAISRWRTQRLEKEKLRLEAIVNERTAEVVKQKDEIVQQRDEIMKQKDEIEEKSNRLETALAELNEAQSELIRQEKMATVGKLTQGLIDRILNPLNYINNFTKLSEGLVKDVEANIEDEKANFDEENYEDTMDVLGMLSGNLKKVSEHGQSTTRTLKAMEEMLKDRTGGIVPMDLSAVLHQNEQMTVTYYAKEISERHINVVFDYPAEGLFIDGNADQLSKTFMSLLGNAVYAVVKKASREQYAAEIFVKASVDEKNIVLLFRDNGIGIEDTILDKIFDPFFTTKTTGEASGVGLYLSREIIQNHRGDISVKSVKNEFTEFTVVLPKRK